MESSAVRSFLEKVILILLPILAVFLVWVADAASLRVQRSAEQYTDKKIEALEIQINHRLERIADRQDEMFFLLKGRAVQQ